MRIALALGLALATALGLALWKRCELAERALLGALASRGVPGALRVARLGPAGATLEALRLGAEANPDLGAARVELGWSLAGLLARRLDRVELHGLRARAAFGAEGLDVGALEALAGAPGAGPRAPALPFAEARLADAELRLETPEGAFTLRADGEATLEAGTLRGDLALAAETPFGRIEGKAGLAGTSAEPRFTLEATASALERPGLLRLEGVKLRAETGLAELHATLAVARARDLATPARVTPLALEAELSGPFERLALDASAVSSEGGVRFGFAGVLEPAAGRADLALRLRETELGPERRPARIFPALEGVVLRARGHVGAEGRLRFAEGALEASVTLAFRGLDLRTPYATLRQLDGAVELRGPAPLTTPPGQLVSLARIEGALPLTSGVIAFQLAPDALVIERASWALAGGRLTASGRLPLAAEERTLTLSAEGLDVATLLSALAFEGLSGTGTLAGALPLRQRGARLRIEGGQLRATAPGVLRYASGPGAAALAEQQPELGTALAALADLRYEELGLELSGDTAEAMDVKLRVRGHNPNFQGGRPVVLEVNVEARLADLVKAGEVAYRVPAEIEERVRRVLDAGER
jgi:hypothetical protein